MNGRIAACLFDQDGTLYPEESTLTTELRRKTRSWIQRRTGVDDDRFDAFYKDLAKAYPNPFEGFRSLGLNIEEYHAEVFDTTDPARFLRKDDRLIDTLQAIVSPKSVVTFASKRYSGRLQRALGIDRLMEKTFFVSDYPVDAKDAVYLDAIRPCGLDPRDVCVIGNNYATDIAPALKHGFKTVLVGHFVHGMVCVPGIYDVGAVLGDIR